MEGPSTVWEQEPGGASVKRGGGYGDKRQIFMGPEFGMRDPPVTSCANDLDLQPDPGDLVDDVEAGDDKRPQEQPEGYTMEDRVDLRYRRAPGAPANCGGGFSPTVSLIT